MQTIKITEKLETSSILLENIEAQHIIRFNLPKKISVVFHNGSSYAYNFIVKKFSKKFEAKLECFGENIEKRKTFSAQIEKQI